MLSIRLALLLLVAPALAHAQVPVHLNTVVQPDDPAGRQVIVELREVIRASPGLRLVEDPKQWPYLRHNLVALRYSEALTVLSHSFVFDSAAMPLSGAFISSSVQFCGRDVAARCARDALNDMSRAMDELKQRAPDLWKQLQ